MYVYLHKRRMGNNFSSNVNIPLTDRYTKKRYFLLFRGHFFPRALVSNQYWLFEKKKKKKNSAMFHVLQANNPFHFLPLRLSLFLSLFLFLSKTIHTYNVEGMRKLEKKGKTVRTRSKGSKSHLNKISIHPSSPFSLPPPREFPFHVLVSREASP